ncbi:MAG: DUF4384 domain-containing protein [Nitrospirota bacterium]
MPYRLLAAAMMVAMFAGPVYAAQSTIIESEGNACLGDDRSRKQTEQAALTEAKKKAVENVSTYVKSETTVKDFALQKDLLSALAQAEVKVVQEIAADWYKSSASGDCYKVKIKAEVVPNHAAMEKMATDAPAALEDPSAPLTVKLWADKKAYKTGEKIKIFIKGNKPFYARVLYRDAAGETTQLLPNPLRTADYFNGGTVYEIPAGGDQFDLAVSPPFGEENITVYASTTPLGDIRTETRGAVYKVKTRKKDIDELTRGVRITEKKDNKAYAASAAEFFEHKVVVKTEK